MFHSFTLSVAKQGVRRAGLVKRLKLSKKCCEVSTIPA